MLINTVKIELCCDQVNPDISFSMRDRDHVVVQPTQFKDLCHVDIFELKFPNTFYIDIVNSGPESMSINIKNLSLSGLKLTDAILDQICWFTPVNHKESKITRNITTSGTVYIDFFSADWIQYHLIYGNKIR